MTRDLGQTQVLKATGSKCHHEVPAAGFSISLPFAIAVPCAGSSFTALPCMAALRSLAQANHRRTAASLANAT